VRAARVREPSAFVDGRLDRGTLDEVHEVVASLDARAALAQIDALRTACDRAGNLPPAMRSHLGGLVATLEQRLQ
jgi:hypothetical protein